MQCRGYLFLEEPIFEFDRPHASSVERNEQRSGNRRFPKLLVLPWHRCGPLGMRPSDQHGTQRFQIRVRTSAIV